MHTLPWLIGSLFLLILFPLFAASPVVPLLQEPDIPAHFIIKDSYIVTFQEPVNDENPVVWLPDRSGAARGEIPFPEHSSGQSKEMLANELGIKGKVNRIFDTMNAAHLLISAEEAERLQHDKRVKSVAPNIRMQMFTTQNNPGWALDRLDQDNRVLNNQYNYTSTGTGRTIYILDSGLSLGVPAVAAEFGNRASIFYDFNTGGDGADCDGYGTAVASTAAGNTYGVAKGATLRIVKIDEADCNETNAIDRAIASFNWLTSNAPRGTIVNFSRGLSFGNGNCSSWFRADLETSIRNAFNAGIIVVVAAGNDGCDTSNYSPANIPESFVVGATSNTLFPT